MEPNEAQKRAINFPFDKPLKVVAGAGTGKTLALTLRYVRCLGSLGIPPRNLLALTFSNKAAAEMRDRILQEASHQGLGGPEDFAEGFVGTFHSFAARLLREHSVLAGIDPGFRVAQTLDARLVWMDVIREYLGTSSTHPTGVPYERADLLQKHVYHFVLSLKDSAVSPEAFLKAALEGASLFASHLSGVLPEVGERKRQALSERALAEARYEEDMARVVYDLYRAYQAAMRSRGLLDFGDLLLEAVLLLEGREDLRETLRESYRYIMVDEFQDTNTAQFRLVSLLSEPNMANVTVVGDEKQAIYGWRNARVENVEDFQAEAWGGGTVNLNINYRSFGDILDVAHSSITRSERFSSRAQEIRLVPHRGFAHDSRVALVHAASVEAEAAHVAEEIARAQEEGTPYRGMAILMRSVKTSGRPFEDALRSRGIPYETIGGTGFYDRQEVRDVLAFLRVAHDPYDNVALVRLMQRPPFSMGDRLIYQIASAEAARAVGDRGGLYLFDALMASENPEALRLVGFLKNLIARRSRLTLGDLLVYALEESGYARYLYSLPGDEGRRALGNIAKVINGASAFEREGPLRGIGDFARYVLFTLDDDVEEPEAAPSGLDVVSIMTVHQAKGLEFPRVFVVDAREGRFPVKPRYPHFHFESSTGLTVKADPEGENTLKFAGDGIPSWPSRVKAFSREIREEERRLWYVALTRAMDHLWVSCSGEPGEFFQEAAGEVQEGRLPAEFREADRGPDGAPAPGRTAMAQAPSVPSAMIRKQGPKPRVSMSFSALRAYLSCPRRYRALYQWGLDAVPRLQRGAAGRNASVMGRLIHGAIRLYHVKGRPNDEAVLAEAARFEGLTEAEYREHYRERALELFGGYLRTELSLSHPDPGDLERPFRWRLETEGVVLEVSGVIDRVERRPDEVWLVDYKTGGLGEKEMEIYGHQMHIYRMAVGETQPDLSSSRMFLLGLPEGALWQVPDTEARTRALLVDVAARVAGNRDEPVVPGKMEACPYCELAPYCCPGVWPGQCGC